MTVTTNDSANQSQASSDDGKNQSSNEPLIKDPEAFLRKHNELLAETKTAKAKLKEFQEKERLKEEEEAKKRGDYEKLIKDRDEELLKLKGELTTHKTRMESASKLAAVLDAVDTDIERKWFDIIPLDQIILNPETGEIDQMSVTKTVENLKKTWPEMFKAKGKGLPVDAPNGNSAGTITREDWMKLSSKDMKRWKDSQIVG